MGSMRADYGRHKVFTYMKIEPTCKQKRRERKRKEKSTRKGRKI